MLVVVVAEEAPGSSLDKPPSSLVKYSGSQRIGWLARAEMIPLTTCWPPSVGGAVGTIQVSPVRNIIQIGNDETAICCAPVRDFRGRIDEVRIVNRALNSLEVQFDATHSLSPPAVTDCNGNGVPDLCDPEWLDLDLFVAQLLVTVQNPVLVCMYDGQGDGQLNSRDIGPFLGRVLAP